MTPIFELSKVAVRLGRAPILKSISCTIGEGEVVAVIGPGGGGKTTFLRLLASLTPAHSGTVHYRDRPLTAWKRGDYLKEIGATFQRGGLFDSMTGKENLFFALSAREPDLRKNKAELEKRADDVLETVGLGGRGSLYPYEMSGGMQKRLGIARALICRPRVVLLDEPTAGLDPVTARGILRTLLDVRKQWGITCLLVTNDPWQVRRDVDRVLYLSEGRLLVDGDWTTVEQAKDPEVQTYMASTRWEGFGS